MSGVSERQIVVDGVKLTIEQVVQKRRVYVKVNRVVGRDRKRKIDITGGVETELKDAVSFVALLKRVAALPTARCSCDYRYGFSDHADHCQSIHVATYEGGVDDD